VAGTEQESEGTKRVVDACIETALGCKYPSPGRSFPMWSSGWQTIFSGPPTSATRFLAQQSDVMDAVQRMRKKAQDKGNLKSTEQQRVETKVIESKSVIVVEQANPQVVYVTLVTIRSWCTVPPSILILLFTIRPAGYYAGGLAIAFGVACYGGVLGRGWGWDAVGAATTSTSTGTIISTATRTLVAATATTSAVGTDHRISRLAAMATGRRLNRFVAVAITAEIAIDGNTT